MCSVPSINFDTLTFRRIYVFIKRHPISLLTRSHNSRKISNFKQTARNFVHTNMFICFYRDRNEYEYQPVAEAERFADGDAYAATNERKLNSLSLVGSTQSRKTLRMVPCGWLLDKVRSGFMNEIELIHSNHVSGTGASCKRGIFMILFKWNCE